MFIEIAFPLTPAPLLNKPLHRTVISPQNRSPENTSNTPSEIAGNASYWSWTLKITSFPFIFWAWPFYIITSKPTTSDVPITSTKSWLKRIFNCKRYPCTCILSIILLIYTLVINLYVAYVFGDLFHSLFIRGTYEISMLSDILDFFQYLPIAIPLNYVWLWGFKVNNFIYLLDQAHRRHGGIGCATFRLRLVLMLLVIVVIHTVRYFSYEKYILSTKRDFRTVVATLSEFSLDIFCTLLLPLYCTFCYAVKFELLVIKAVIYNLLRKKVVPSVGHLNKFKVLYTRAEDLILEVNKLFSLYMSLVLLILLVSTATDAENLWGTLGAAITSAFGSTSPWSSFFAWMLQSESFNENEGEAEEPFSPTVIREINSDVACILLTYGLIFYTVWQAVRTNDCAREIHVWLNDFVMGGAGTDVHGILQDLGFKTGESKSSTKSDAISLASSNVVNDDEESELEVIWASNYGQEDGEFIQKFHMLKSYIHVRMEVEKASLLSISLIGWLIPSMSGRLKRYNILF